jgi:hypothetical protein
MTQKHPVQMAEEANLPVPAAAVGLPSAIADGLGALYASLARLTLAGLESVSDRRAEARAAQLSARARGTRRKKSDRIIG